MMMPSSHYVGSIMLPSGSYTSYSSLILIPLLPVEKKEFIVKNSTTKSGRPRLLCSISPLALGLAWTRTRGSYMILQIIFGLTHGSLNIWLRLSRRMIVKVLQTNEDAIVRLPTAAETTLFASMIHKKYPLVNIFGEQWMI
jgi:hypothetical protein